MDEQTNVKTIALKDLWDIFVKRAWIMVLVAAIAVGSFFAISQALYVPEYSSNATIHVYENSEGGSLNQTDLNVADKVINDCIYTIKHEKVLRQVMANLALSETYKSLYNKVSTSNPNGTRYIEVTVKAATPEQAKEIVDAICLETKNTIMENMNYDVSIVMDGRLNTAPSNTTSLTTYALVGIVAAVLVYGIFFLMFMLDDSVWTDEEIEKYLGVSILGDIPDANSTRKKGYGYGKYGKYGAYGRYGAYGAYGNNPTGADKGGKK
jgi:capsular polysaccharide biosynthesis protein